MKNLGLIASLGMAVSACQAARPIQLEDYYRIEGASTPVISPDGKWVVFGRSMIVEGENQRRNDLWIAPSDGSSAAVMLVDGASGARWSPDGKLLGYSRGGGGRGGRGGGGEGEGNEWFLRMDHRGSAPIRIPGVAG